MKIRAYEILDGMRFTEQVTLKNTEGYAIARGEVGELRLTRYGKWWVTHAEGTELTVSEEEACCRNARICIGCEPRIVDVTEDGERRYALFPGVTVDDLPDNERVLLKYGKLPETNHERSLQLSALEMAGFICSILSTSDGCNVCHMEEKCEYVQEGCQNGDGYYKWLQEPYAPRMFDMAWAHMRIRGPKLTEEN